MGKWTKGVRLILAHGFSPWSLCSVASWPGMRQSILAGSMWSGSRERTVCGGGGWDKITPFNSHFLQLCLPPSPTPFSAQKPVQLNPSVVRWGQNPMAQPFLKASCLNPTALGTKPLTQSLGNGSEHNWVQLTRMFVAQDPRPWHSLMRKLFIDCCRRENSKEVERGSQLLTAWGPWPHPGGSTSKPLPLGPSLGSTDSTTDSSRQAMQWHLSLIHSSLTHTVASRGVHFSSQSSYLTPQNSQGY